MGRIDEERKVATNNLEMGSCTSAPVVVSGVAERRSPAVHRLSSWRGGGDSGPHVEAPSQMFELRSDLGQFLSEGDLSAPRGNALRLLRSGQVVVLHHLFGGVLLRLRALAELDG